jgi:NTP pyrophosphatase (non-canonical NTP hydrolase)
MCGEAGELCQLMEKHVYYGKPLDRVKVGEEVGDALWYLAEMCNALGLDMGAIMDANIAKLKARFPDKFTYERADRDNRDLTAERNAVAPALGGDKKACPADHPRPYGYDPDEPVPPASVAPAPANFSEMQESCAACKGSGTLNRRRRLRGVRCGGCDRRESESAGTRGEGR